MKYYHERLQGWSDFVGYYRDMVAEASDGAVFAEVGIWKGRSTIAMGEFIRESGKSIHFTAVDHFLGSAEHQEELSETGISLQDEFLYHHAAAGLDDIVHLLALPSVAAAVMTADQSCDFIYLDASHDHANVTQDLAAWWPKVKDGGTLSGHDWSASWPGVVSAVKQFADENNLKITTYGSTWIIEKPCTSAQVELHAKLNRV